MIVSQFNDDMSSENQSNSLLADTNGRDIFSSNIERDLWNNLAFFTQFTASFGSFGYNILNILNCAPKQGPPLDPSPPKDGLAPPTEVRNEARPGDNKLEAATTEDCVLAII